MSLDAAHAAFESGDFALARNLARKVAESAGDNATKLAAEDLLRRTGVDRAIVGITVVCVVVFVVMVAVTLG